MAVWSDDNIDIKAPCENKEKIQYKPFCNVDPAQKTITFFNDISDSHLANSNSGLVGGNRKEWKQIIQNIGQRYVKQPNPHIGGKNMEDLAEYDIKQIKRTDFPITLTSGKSSFKDVSEQ